MRSEVKIGILAVVAIFLSFWGFKYIQGKNLLTRSNIFYVYYDNVSGLNVGTPVRIRGLEVGSVSDTELRLNDGNVQVTLDLKKEVEIPVGTVASIVTTSLMGGIAIDLEFDRPCGGDDCAVSGSTLPGKKVGILSSMLGEGTVDGFKSGITDGLTGALDSLTDNLLGAESDAPTAVAARDFQATMANLKATSQTFNAMMQRSAGNMERAIKDMQGFASTLEEKREALGNILENADTLSQQMVDANLRQTIEELQDALKQLGPTVDKADRAMGDMANIMNKINDGQGTLGGLINDPELYNRLNNVIPTLDSLITDLSERPYRYVPFKGRNRVLRYDRKDAELQDNNN